MYNKCAAYSFLLLLLLLLSTKVFHLTFITANAHSNCVELLILYFHIRPIPFRMTIMLRDIYVFRQIS